MNDAALREHVLFLLDGGGAHLDFKKAVAGIPAEFRGAKPANIPHSPWRLVEHMRICQWDILEFSRNPDHVSPDFPDGYWPVSDAPPDDLAWDKCLSDFRDDLEAMRQLVRDESTTCSPRFRMATARLFFAKRCWWRTTMPTTLVSW